MYKITLLNVFLAENVNWGKNISKWLTDQASAIAIGIMAFTLLPILFKRNWAMLITTLFSGAIAIYFIYNPEKLVYIGNIIYSIIFGGE